MGVAIVPGGAIAGFNTDGLKTLPIIGPTLSRNLGLITLKEREPTPAANRHLDADPLGLVDRSGLIRFKQQ
jgi:DNA-binding transcriptional LysR family regulator